MYIILEYLAYVAVVSTLAAVLFAASAMFLISKEGAKRLAETSRKIAEQATNLVDEHLQARKATQPQNPHSS